MYTSRAVGRSKKKKKKNIKEEDEGDENRSFADFHT